MNTIPAFHTFTDSHLINEMPLLVASETVATAIVVAGLAEFDASSI